MSIVGESLRYPITMSVVLVGFGAMLLAFVIDLVLTESIVAGLLGMWGIIIATVGALAVLAIWLIGKLEH